jgi:hypothetical protein
MPDYIKESKPPVQCTVISPSRDRVLGRRFEDEVKKMHAKADDQKRLLEQCENKSNLYGKRPEELRSVKTH